MKKIMYGALMLVLVGVLGIIININTAGVEAFTFSSVDVNEKQEVSAKGITNIIIESPSVDVNLIPSNGDEIGVEFSGKVGKKSKKLYKLDIEEDGNTVEITMEKENKFQFMMFNFTRVSLDVEVPQKVYDSIQINASSGDILVEEIEAKDIEIETNSGDIEVVDSIQEGLSLTASSGDVVAKDNESNSIKIKTSSGDITVNDNVANTIDLLASSGDIISNNQNTGTMAISTSSGDITVDAEKITGDLSLEASSGDIEVTFLKTPESIAVDYKGGSGDGSANLDDMSYKEKSEHRIIGEIGSGEYKLTARTSSGDFKVK